MDPFQEEENYIQGSYFRTSSKTKQILQNLIKTPRTVLKLQKKQQEILLDMKRLVHHQPDHSQSFSKLQNFESTDNDKLKNLVSDRAIGLRPRFSAHTLQQMLKHKIVISKQKAAKQLPIDYYQAILYKLNSDWNYIIPGQTLTIKCVKKIHHISRLKTEQHTFSEIQKQEVNQSLSTILQKNPTIYAEYDIFKQALDLLNNLAIKYGLINLYDYSYRLSDRSLNVRLLDLQEMNKEFFTVETIWLAVMVEKYPLKGVVSDLAKQSAKMLASVVINIANYVGSLNSDCPFQEVKDILRLVAVKNPLVSQLKGIEPDFDAQVVDYQRLKLKRGCFGYCLKGSDVNTPQTIKAMLIDLEYAYRTFEQELIGNLLSHLEIIAN